jgi:nicotinamidase-related amidase
VILTGIAGNICVLFTANDAYMRDLKIFTPAGCIVSNTATENDHALRQNRHRVEGQRHGVWAAQLSPVATAAAASCDQAVEVTRRRVR